jgi:hypothetical protein
MLVLPEMCNVEIIRVWIPNSIEIQKSNSLKDYRKLLFIVVESDSRLAQMESHAFSQSSLQSIGIWQQESPART